MTRRTPACSYGLHLAGESAPIGEATTESNTRSNCSIVPVCSPQPSHHPGRTPSDEQQHSSGEKLPRQRPPSFLPRRRHAKSGLAVVEVAHRTRKPREEPILLLDASIREVESRVDWREGVRLHRGLSDGRWGGTSNVAGQGEEKEAVVLLVQRDKDLRRKRLTSEIDCLRRDLEGFATRSVFSPVLGGQRHCTARYTQAERENLCAGSRRAESREFARSVLVRFSQPRRCSGDATRQQTEQVRIREQQGALAAATCRIRERVQAHSIPPAPRQTTAPLLRSTSPRPFW